MRNNWAMQDYASLHGFNALGLDGRTPDEVGHLPEFVRFRRSTGGVNWAAVAKKHGVKKHEIGKLEKDLLLEEASASADLSRAQGMDMVSIGTEGILPPPGKLTRETWYPKEP